MNCDEVRSALPEILTGASAEREEITKHLAECNACRVEADEIARAINLIRETAVNTSAGAVDSLPHFESVLAAARVPRGRGRRLLVRAAALIVAALAGAAVDRLVRAPAPAPAPPLRAPLADTSDVRVVARAVAANEPGTLGASLAVLDVLSHPRHR